MKNQISIELFIVFYSLAIMNIYELSKCPEVRPIVDKMIDRIDETGGPIFREGLRELMGKEFDRWLLSSIVCERCERRVMIRWLRTPSQDGLAMLIHNPSRYLLEDEIVVCGDCKKKIAGSSGVLFYCQQNNAGDDNYGWSLSFNTQGELETCLNADNFEFKSIRQPHVGLCVYNKRYDYYVHINSYSRTNKNKISDLQLRASNFNKYDPYVAHRITLFELLCHNL